MWRPRPAIAWSHQPVSFIPALDQQNLEVLMLDRRHLFGVATATAMLPRVTLAQGTSMAATRLDERGPENGALALRTGLWDVTETAWKSADATPVTSTGLVADRRMFGWLLQEMLHPAGDASDQAVKRIDYLSFQQAEARWDYASMDMRDNDGIMCAWSFTRGEENRIEFTFNPFAVLSPGPNMVGQMLRMTQVITHQGPNQDTKEQYFTFNGGSGVPYLGHRYVYVRRS